MWKLPDGAAFYAHCLRSKHTTRIQPEEVLGISALSEVARIEGEWRDSRAPGHRSDNRVAPSKLAAYNWRRRNASISQHDEGRQPAWTYQRSSYEMNAGLDPIFATRPKGPQSRARADFREKTSAGAYYQTGDLAAGVRAFSTLICANMAVVHKNRH